MSFLKCETFVLLESETFVADIAVVKVRNCCLQEQLFSIDRACCATPRRQSAQTATLYLRSTAPFQFFIKSPNIAFHEHLI